MAATWWSRRFVEVLESYGLGTRMQRGRRYARSGQVVSLDVHAATIAAQVQGSRRTPHLVAVSLPEPTPAQWQAIDAAMRAKVGFAAQLLAGEVPADLEEVFRAAGVALFPRTWKELRARCSCPDWENPCKHIAAVLYVFADQLDTDPGCCSPGRDGTRDEILDPLRGSSVLDETADEVAQWWPFNGSSMPQPGDLPPPAGDVQQADPAHPDAVLDGLEALDLTFAGVPFREAVSHAYVRLVDAALNEPDEEKPTFRRYAQLDDRATLSSGGDSSPRVTLGPAPQTISELDAAD